MISCIIIEDQPPAQRVLKKYISELGNLNLKATFADALAAIDFLKIENVDLIFLDIHLPKISGIEFLRVMKYKPNVILTTAFPDYALESYEYNVVDYLLKPFSFERFVQAVNKTPSNRIKESINEVKDITEYLDIIFIKSGYEHIKIATKDIRFIKSDADYTEIFTKSKKYLSQETLKYWLEFLNPKQFTRIHKSYILNTLKIQKIIGNKVQLEGNEQLPIGRAYKEGFMQKLVN